MKTKTLVGSLALLGLASHAVAQTQTQPQDPVSQRVEITGSSIRRIQTEGALPLQTITRAEIERQGIVSAEQLVARLSANGNGADNLSSNVGIQQGSTDRNNNGNSSANLRGLGANSTLVLLNGRRVSTHGAKANAVDLNTIPLAAVERVEVLKDGASAIYGTDAIGGVINFILRRDYTGLEATAFADITEHKGGNIYRGSLTGGAGNLAADGFNVMASVTFDKQEKLGGYGARAFANGFQPERGLSPDTTGTPYATQTGAANTGMGASFVLPGSTQSYNRANLLSFQGRCDTVPGMQQYQAALWGNLGFGRGCSYDYGGAEVLIQPVERTNLVARGSYALTQQHTLIAEVTGSRTKAEKSFEPYQITTSLLTGANYPVGGPYYQDLSAFIPTFDRTRPIAYRWRCDTCGNREIETTTDAYRLLLGAEGSVLGRWDYKTGVSTARSKATSLLVGGYLYQDAMIAALGSGEVNPWLLPGQSQTAAGLSRLAAASANGRTLLDGEAKLLQFDGTVSGEIFQLPAGPLAAALGIDVRRESYQFRDGVGTRVIYQAAQDANFPYVKRNITAAFAEAVVPIVSGLEATLALRRDHYSDFGDTTNPKVSLKWVPISQLLLRGSYNEGFRAPSFFQVYGPAPGLQPVPGNIADPVLCPGGNVAGANLAVCAIRPNFLSGSNRTLKPETSKQWTVGFVVSPVDWMSFSADLWEIKRTDLIYELTPQQVVSNFTTFPENLVRGPNGFLDEPGGFIRAGFVNADGDITRGVDVSLKFNGRVLDGVWTAALDGTYMDSHRSRIFASQPYVETVGRWSSRDLFVRWKHNASVTYTQGAWSGTLVQAYTDSYRDERPSGVVPPGFDPKVKAYTVYDLSATYSGIKNFSITAGVKNLFDKDPPFTAHNVDFAAGAGWDPRVADPRLRAYTLRLNYKFF